MRDKIIIYVNGRKYDNIVDPMERLSAFLARNGLTGTKTSCKEGGCGVCTVMQTLWENNQPHHKALLACLTPVIMCDMTLITTIEGLGNVKNPHPLQQHFSNATQCGFCTPGFVMSVYAEYFNGKPDAAQMRKAVDGNICRCTGYNALNQVLEDIEETVQEVKAPEFPKELQVAYESVCVENKQYAGEAYKNCATIQPTTYQEVQQFIEKYGQCKIMAGGSDVMVDFKTSNKMPKYIVSIAKLEANRYLSLEKGVLKVGALVTIHEFEEFLKLRDARAYDFFQQVYALFASHHIRQTATMCGNLMNCSSASDNMPIFMALGCTLKLLNLKTMQAREMDIDALPVGYHQPSSDKFELLTGFECQLDVENLYFKKLARRRHDDICVVSAAAKFWVQGEVVQRAKICFGRMDEITTHMKHLEAYFVNLKVGDAEKHLQEIEKIVRDNYTFPPNVVRTEPEYRTAMTCTLVQQFFLQAVKSDKQFEKFVYQDKYSHEYDYEAPTSQYVTQNVKHIAALQQATGEAIYPTNLCESQGITTLHAYPVFPGAAKGTFKYKFTVEQLKAKYPNLVDFVTAKDIKGTNQIGIAVKDEHVIVPEDKEFISPSECIGVVVATTYEDAFNISRLMLRDKFIEITADPRPIVTIADAKAAGTFLVSRRLDRLRGEQKPDQAKFTDLIKELEQNPDIIKFTHHQYTPPQEQFYLEVQGTSVFITEDHFVLNAGTQNQKGTQTSVATVLGLNMADVVVNTKRLGGGFGGKEGCFIYSCLAAIAAQKLNRPMSLFLDYGDDMMYTGKRHEAEVDGTLYFNKQTKKFVFLDVQGYLEGGYSTDLSPAVLERFVYHLDNAYAFESARFVGQVCKTNSRSNTAFRGFGAPQAILYIETMLQSFCTKHGYCLNEIRKNNFYQTGDKTPFGQTVEKAPIQEACDQTLEKSKFSKIKKEVDEFNKTHQHLKQGVAFCPLKFGVSFGQSFLNQGHALVHIYTDGSIAVSHMGIEMGQGLNTRLLQVVCQDLNVEQKYVKILETSTLTTANTAPTSASSGYDLNAGAIRNALSHIKEQMGEFYQKYVNKEMTWATACNAAWFNRRCLSSVGHYAHPISGFNFETQQGQPFYYFAASGAVVHVQINKKTGEYQLLKAELVIDVGKSVNPLIDLGQIEGAFIQGVGWLTTEELLYKNGLVDGKIKRTGRYTSNGPGNYKVPSIFDIPCEFNVNLLKGQVNEKIVYGSKGIGEPPLCLGVAAFLALREAAGEDLLAPATIMNVWRAK